MKTPILLDTDIGTDVDDAWALALALSLVSVRLVGVSTVYGDTSLRGSIALKLLHLARRFEVPVAVGRRCPLGASSGAFKDYDDGIYWEGHEGEGILGFDGDDPRQFHPLPAHEFILKMSEVYAGNLVIVAIGPLSNVAQAVLSDRSLKNRVKSIVLMGGGFYRERTPRPEHNFRCDPTAARIVLHSGIPVKMVGYNVTGKCSFSRKEFRRITANPTPFASTLRGLTEIYLRKKWDRWKKRRHLKRVVWTDRSNPTTLLHDPLTLLAAVYPDVIRFEPCFVTVGLDGVTGLAEETMSSAHVERAVDFDGVSFRDIFCRRIRSLT